MVSVSVETMILVAIALILAFAAALTILIYMGTFYGKSTEAVMVLGDSYLNKSSNEVHLHLYVTLRPYAEIYKIEIDGMYVDMGMIEIENVESGKAVKENNCIRIWGGSYVWLTVHLLNNGNLTMFLNSVEVKIYTYQGYVYRGMVRVIG